MSAEEYQVTQIQAILDAMSDGVIVSDPTGNVRLVNLVAEMILARQREDLVGQPVQELFATFEEAGQQKILAGLLILQQQISQAAVHQVAQPPEMREVTLTAGQRVISARLTLAAASTPVTPGLVIVLRDISPEALADRTRSEFISNVSHELRTPMTSIKGYITLLQQEAVGVLNEKQTYFLGIIGRNIDRLSRLINDLLDVSRIESGQIKLVLEAIQLADLAQHVIETLFISAKNKGLTLTLEAPPHLSLVQVDQACITQVLTNLVANAIAYTETGSVEIILQEVADFIQVSVKDTGVGLTADEITRIFDRFYRTDNDVVQVSTGTGLGLSIVKTYVEMHGGRIWVESQPNQGATFTFILPLAAKAFSDF